MTIRVFQVDPAPTLMPYDYEKEAIAQAGGEFVIGDCHTEDDVLSQAGDAEILLVSWKHIVTPRVMDELPHVRLLARWGVGYDQFDPAAAQARGIAVANTPNYCTEEVAEHTIALLLSAARRVPHFHQEFRAGAWPHYRARPIYRLAGRTLGLVGLGRIGAAVAWRARGLGLRVIAADPYLNPDQIRERGAEPRSMDELLAEADYISLHVALSPATRHLINADALNHMQPHAILINTCRGPVVDEGALVDALASGRIGGAALDVFESEPLSPDSPLRALDNVILTPHAAAYSEQSWFGLREEMVQVVTDWMRESWCRSVVNPGVRANLRPRLKSTE